MRNKKDSEKLRGTVSSKIISLNIDKRLYRPLRHLYNSDTEIIRSVFIEGLNLEDSKDLEEYVFEILKKQIGMEKRDKFTEKAEQILANKIIIHLENKLKNNSFGLIEKRAIENQITEAKEVLDELK